LVVRQRDEPEITVDKDRVGNSHNRDASVRNRRPGFASSNLAC
jgi:hypothetical protein